LLTIEAFRAAGMIDGLLSVTDNKDAPTYLKRKGRYAKAHTPALIFLDISQPTPTALKILSALKSMPGLVHIPIVVAAGSDNPNFVRALYALNGNCFIRRPF
jgi:CheY-like chemotaxis protein